MTSLTHTELTQPILYHAKLLPEPVLVYCQLDSIFIKENSFENAVCENGGYFAQQSGRSPKVVALFLLQILVAIEYDYFNCLIQSK